MLRRDNIAPPTRRAEAVRLGAAPFGGDVQVRQLTLGEWLAAEEAAGGARDVRLFPHLLAACVVDADGVPIWCAADWDLWAVEHAADFSRLLDAALRVNGRAPGDAKNA